MSEWLKVSITALLTVATFVIGQMLQRIWIEPIQEQRRVKGKIAHALSFYRSAAWANNHELPPDDEGARTKATEMQGINGHIRGLAAELRQSVAVIPWYGLLERCRMVIRRDTVRRVVHELFQWSRLDSRNSDDVIRTIRGLLRISVDEPRSGQEIDELERENRELVKRNAKAA